MTDILEEVLNDHKDEKKLYYFRKLLPFVIVVTIIVVIAMLAYDWRSAKQNEYNIKMGDILLKSINVVDVDPSAAFNSLNDLIQKKGSKIAQLALIEQVGIKLNSKDYAAAKDILEKIIDSKNYYNITTSYARIAWMCLLIDQNIISEQENQKFQEYSDYFSNESKEFFSIASLIKAYWYIRNNHIDLAKEILKTTISINNVTAVVKEQAQALLSTIE